MKMSNERINGIQFSQIVGRKIKDNQVVQVYSCSNMDDLLDNPKIAIDSNILTSAISKKEFYGLLTEESNGCQIFITEKNKSEVIGNLRAEGFSKEKAQEKFEKAKNDLNIIVLPYYKGCEEDAANLFEGVIKSMKISKIQTFLSDCIILVVLRKNKLNIYYSNDSELKEVCERFLPDIKVREIKTKEEIKKKELKEVDKMLRNLYPKSKTYWKKHKVRR